MPAKKPPPISPEGRRAAERIRTIFYSIAAANLVLVAIVMWRRSHEDKTPAPESTQPATAANGVSSRAVAAPVPAKRNQEP